MCIKIFKVFAILSLPNSILINVNNSHFSQLKQSQTIAKHFRKSYPLGIGISQLARDPVQEVRIWKTGLLADQTHSSFFLLNITVLIFRLDPNVCLNMPYTINMLCHKIRSQKTFIPIKPKIHGSQTNLQRASFGQTNKIRTTQYIIRCP